MHYVQFLVNGEEAIGSNGVFILDDRDNLRTMIFDSKERGRKLTRHMHKNYDGFSIRKGNLYAFAEIHHDKL